MRTIAAWEDFSARIVGSAIPVQWKRIAFLTFMAFLLASRAHAQVFVNAGGPAYTDTLGNHWSADAGFTGGAVSSTASAIANTPDPTLYQNNRHGIFSYQFNVPAGNYNVILKFAETYWTSTGQRLFNVSINGTQVLTNFDIVAAAGAPLTAIDKSFPVSVTGSSITIQFTSGTVDLPIVNAVEVVSASGVFVQVSPTTASLYASQQQQFTASVSGNTNTAVTWTYSPQVGTLTTGGLYTAPASITAAQTLTVTATSQADSTKSASATINLLPTAGSNVFYYFDDALGSARVITNSTGTVCYDADFYPFGGERAYTNNCTQNYKFTGKERDSESGLDNFGARYNSSQYGRFMTSDPAGKQSVVISNPQTWNKYTYVLNNPLRLVDPSGKFPTDAHIYWGVTVLKSIGFDGNASRLSKNVNTILDHGYFFTDRLHALSGDAAFHAARSQLFSMALDSNRSDGERGVALMMGMHLVEDYQAHKGLNGVFQHFKKYGVGDANPNSKEGSQALADAESFATGVQSALDKSLGDEGGQAKLNEMLNAAENFLNTDMIWGAVNDISRGLNQNASNSSGISTPNFSPNLQEEENRQCGLGNRAACN